MEEISLEEKVSKLERRVTHLEAEVDSSFEEKKFRGRINRIFPGESEIETRSGPYGLFARVTDINGDDVQTALDRLEDTSYGTAVTETSDGLGMEVWQENGEAP